MLKLIKNHHHIDRDTPPLHPETLYVVKFLNEDRYMHFALSEVFNYLPENIEIKNQINILYSKWENNKLPLHDRRIKKWIKHTLNKERQNMFLNNNNRFVDMSGMDIDIIKYQNKNIAVYHIKKFYPEFVLTKSYLKELEVKNVPL